MERIDKVMRHPLFRSCLAKNKEYERQRVFCKHDFHHVADVARIAYILMLESGDFTTFCNLNNFDAKQGKEVVYAAGLLHDMGRWREYEAGEDHSLIGADLAVEVLVSAGFSEHEITQVTRAIREHRSKAVNRLVSLLGSYLARADKLSRVCTLCSARQECYKYQQMETGKISLIS